MTPIACFLQRFRFLKVCTRHVGEIAQIVCCGVCTTLLAACLFAFAATACAKESSPIKGGATADKTDSLPQFVVSKETTYITEPLRSDGTVDYVAALNQQLSQGVTSENNAAVCFWQALGPECIERKIRKQYFAMLGIAELPKQGDYFVDFQDFLQQTMGWKKYLGDTDEDFDKFLEAERNYKQAQNYLWSEKQHPLIAKLLTKNEKFLQRIVDGSRRPRYYSPLVPMEGDSLTQVQIAPGSSQMRDVMQQLAARAMLRANRGDYPGAGEDVWACFRIVERYSQQQPFWVNRMKMQILKRIVYQLATRFAQQADLPAAQLCEYAAQVNRLRLKFQAFDIMHDGERFFVLAGLIDNVRPIVDRAESLKKMGRFYKVFEVNAEEKARTTALLTLRSEPGVDWDEALRQKNHRCDQLAKVYAEPSLVKRQAALDRFEMDIAEAGAKRTADKVLSLSDEERRTVAGAQKAQWICDLTPIGAADVLCQRDAALDIRGDLAVLAFALAAYRRDCGRYPQTLRELTPKYLAALPTDPYSEKDFRYAPTADGYLLYSVGPNGKDDGGHNYAEEREFWDEDVYPSQDDIGIRMPPRETKTD